MVSTSGDLVILAVRRRDRDLGPGEVELAVGDHLLLEGSWGALDQRLDGPEVLVVDRPDLVRRQTVAMGHGSKRAMAVLVAMVVLLATGVVPSVVAGLLAAGAMIVLGVVGIDRAYRAISWSTVVLVAGMIPLSTAMQTSGAAEDLATGLVRVVGDAGPYMLLIGLFVLTAVFGQLISNTATALIVIPIAISAAAEIGVSAQPVLMCVAVAAAAALLTPVATPANLMVMGPGGYRFGEYWKLGLPLLLWFFVVGTLWVPVVWSF
jgi:di/tricarboxylate transporter